MEVAHEALLTRWSRSRTGSTRTVAGWHSCSTSPRGPGVGRRRSPRRRAVSGCPGSRRRSKRSTSRGVRCRDRTLVRRCWPGGPRCRDRRAAPATTRRLRRRACSSSRASPRWRFVATPSRGVSRDAGLGPTPGGRDSRRPTRRWTQPTSGERAGRRSKPSSAAPSHCVGHNATRPRSSPSRPTGWRTPRGRGRRCSARSPTRSGSSMPTASRAIGARAESSCPTASSAYLTDEDGRVRPYDLDTGALGEALPAVGADDRFPVLVASPDGRRIAIGIEVGPAGRSDRRRRDRRRHAVAGLRPADRRRAGHLGRVPSGRAPRPRDRRGGTHARRRRRQRAPRRQRSKASRSPRTTSSGRSTPARARADVCCGGRPRWRSSAGSCSSGPVTGLSGSSTPRHFSSAGPSRSHPRRSPTCGTSATGPR